MSQASYPSWAPARRQTLLAARGRSRRVAQLRHVFVALAGASFSSVFVFMALFSQDGLFGDAFTTATPLRVINPRFTGTNERGEAYQVTADAAVRQSANARDLDLTGPIYRTLQGHLLVAPRGAYDEARETVRMSGGVLFNDRAGNRFSSPGMVIDLRAGTIRGVDGVTGAGPLGVVRADAYEVRREDGAVVFRGRVRGQVPERTDVPTAGAESDDGGQP